MNFTVSFLDFVKEGEHHCTVALMLFSLLNVVMLCVRQTIKGSTVLFTALLKKCIEKGVVAICRYTARKNMSPRFVALFPQVWTKPLLLSHFSQYYVSSTDNEKCCLQCT